MKTRTFRILLGLVVIAGTADAQPNILMIVGDDFGYSDFGFHGCRDIPTPCLDALAASGVRFTSVSVTGPYCSPTHAGTSDKEKMWIRRWIEPSHGGGHAW